VNIHLLRMFATVVRVGSFSRAAEALHISQPAISKGIRDFELQIGCRLLDRAPKGVRPTNEGLALMRHADALFAIERAAEEEMQAFRGLEGGSLSIGASTTIASYMIGRYLEIFHDAHPGIDLRVISANTREVADLLIGHDIDVALVEGPVDEENLVTEPWRADSMELITCPNHPLAAAKDPVEPEAIANETLLLREPGSGSREVVARVLADRNIKPRRTLEIGSTELIKQAVAAGLGVSIVSAVAVEDHVALKRLKVISLRDLKFQRSLGQLKLPGRIPAPAAAVFERLLAIAPENLMVVPPRN
jgi:DNA-binding transcriptional LysR family regulator